MNHHNTNTTLSEINVTPLVDVMLVLLIVFMISAPLMQQGIEVNLPKVDAPALSSEKKEPILLVIHRDRHVSLAKRTLDRSNLNALIKEIVNTEPNTEVMIQADQDVAYGVVAQVMADIKKAGIHHIGLVTEPSNEKK